MSSVFDDLGLYYLFVAGIILCGVEWLSKAPPTYLQKCNIIGTGDG
jgi:hypothetical protein